MKDFLYKLREWMRNASRDEATAESRDGSSAGPRDGSSTGFRGVLRRWWADENLRLIICLCVTAVLVILSIVGMGVFQHYIDLENSEKERLMLDYVRKENLREDSLLKAARAAESRLFADSAIPVPEAEQLEPEKPKYSWSRLETMVEDLKCDDDALVWKVQDDTSAWMVFYTKGGKDYIRKFNPETDRYWPATRVKKYEAGVYYVYGNKKRRYLFDRRDLVYEVNGVEKDRYCNMHTISIYTSNEGDHDDGYESCEDCFEDNEEDIYLYYNPK